MKKIALGIAILAIMSSAVSCGTGAEEKSKNESESSTTAGLPDYKIAYSDTPVIKKDNKSVLILSASPRKGGNTDLLCDEFAKGAKEAGASVEKIFLDDYKIDFFHAEHEQQVGDSADIATDDAPMIIRKMVDADVIVLSSPVYYMSIDG